MCLKMENKMHSILSLVTILIITGCTTSQFYQSAKQHQINQCKQSASNAEYNDCVKRTDETFNEYNKKREKSLIK